MFYLTLSTQIDHKSKEKYIDDLPNSSVLKTRHTTINENTKLNILLAREENIHHSVDQLSQDHDVPSILMYNFSKLATWNPFKINLVQELSPDDSDPRMEFCQILMTYVMIIVFK